MSSTLPDHILRQIRGELTEEEKHKQLDKSLGRYVALCEALLAATMLRVLLSLGRRSTAKRSRCHTINWVTCSCIGRVESRTGVDEPFTRVAYPSAAPPPHARPSLEA